MDELNRKMQEFSSELYKGAGAHGQPGSGARQENASPQQGDGENVVDADFEASDEKK